jgi:hypothetical protein
MASQLAEKFNKNSLFLEEQSARDRPEIKPILNPNRPKIRGVFEHSRPPCPNRLRETTEKKPISGKLSLNIQPSSKSDAVCLYEAGIEGGELIFELTLKNLPTPLGVDDYLSTTLKLKISDAEALSSQIAARIINYVNRPTQARTGSYLDEFIERNANQFQPRLKSGKYLDSRSQRDIKNMAQKALNQFNLTK